MSKLILGVAGIGGVTGVWAIAVYQTGLFSYQEKKETSTVREILSKEGYELVSTDEKFKTFFAEFKTDPNFMREVNKHKEDNEDLSVNDDKGRDALKTLCSAYLDSKDNLDNTIKWCVLRIQDKPLPKSKSWRNIASDSSDKSTWETPFTNAKNKMIEFGVMEIDSNTSVDTGYAILKTWCSNNKRLPISNKNQAVQENVISWCAS